MATEPMEFSEWRLSNYIPHRFADIATPPNGSWMLKARPLSKWILSRSPERRSEMQTRANGRHTVPQIFIDDVHIGGCDELYALDRSGKLAAMLVP
jgi:hypothetical protein